MLIDLSGRTALVTGSTQGIGAAIAAGLAAAGARVAVNGRSRASVEEALARLRASGGEFVAAPGDITTDEGARSVFEAVPGPTSSSTASGSSDRRRRWRSKTTNGAATSTRTCSPPSG